MKHVLPSPAQMNAMCDEVHTVWFVLQCILLFVCLVVFTFTLSATLCSMAPVGALLLGDPFWQNATIPWEDSFEHSVNFAFWSSLLTMGLILYVRSCLRARFGKSFNVYNRTLDFPFAQTVELTCAFVSENAVDGSYSIDQRSNCIIAKVAENRWLVSYLEVAVVPSKSGLTAVLIKCTSQPKNLFIIFSGLFCDCGSSSRQVLLMDSVFDSFLLFRQEQIRALV